MTDVFYCGIIDGNMSVGGNNKVVFQNDKIVINGGFLYDYSSEMNYSDIKMTYYSTILPPLSTALYFFWIAIIAEILVDCLDRESHLVADCRGILL